MIEECPFIDLLKEQDKEEYCIYMIEIGCEDFSTCPGNSDAWCRNRLEASADAAKQVEK